MSIVNAVARVTGTARVCGSGSGSSLAYVQGHRPLSTVQPGLSWSNHMPLRLVLVKTLERLALRLHLLLLLRRRLLLSAAVAVLRRT
jgi:hypothetical protein